MAGIAWRPIPVMAVTLVLCASSGEARVEPLV